MEILQKEKEKRKLPLEVKKLNNNYYLYHSTTRWDKKEKKVKKVSDYIGRITPKGVIEGKKSNDVRSIYEYGNSELLHLLAKDYASQKEFFDELTIDSKTLMENDRVRVLDVRIKPGEKTKMHSHPDRVRLKRS